MSHATTARAAPHAPLAPPPDPAPTPPVRIAERYRVCRPILDAAGRFTGRTTVFPADENDPYQAWEAFLSLREFCRPWQYLGHLPPRDLEPYAVPEGDRDAAVLRVSELDPDFVAAFDRCRRVGDPLRQRLHNFLSVLAGAGEDD